MTPAASAPVTAAPASGHAVRRFHHPVPWAWLVGVLAALVAVLAGLPDGMAEPVQTAAAWAVIAVIAVLAVASVARGLDLLLDCESN